MNKIEPEKSIDTIRQEFGDFVEPKVRQRLNILIGFLLYKEGISVDLNKDRFKHNGDTYYIGSDADEKKAIIKLFFKRDRENKDRVLINKRKLVLPKRMGDTRIYKPNVSFTNMSSSRFINLSIQLKNLIRNDIDITPGSYLDNQKAFCNALSDKEKEILNVIFPYNLFFQKKDHEWFYASKLANNLKTPVCPYCNREYINSVNTKKGRKVIGPTFDHFLSQKDFPFLKLSFYNLIPSCTTCNSRLKNQKEFDFKNFLYPYYDSYNGLATFKLSYKGTDIAGKFDESKLIKVDDLSIHIATTSKHIDKLHGDGVDMKKGSLNIFMTEYIYNESHKDVAYDILDKYRKTTRHHVKSITKLLNAEGKSVSEVYRFYLSNYHDEKHFNKRPLSRMTKDIANQLDKIYEIKLTE